MIVKVKLNKALLIMFILIILIPNTAFASSNILESTEEALDISSFISEAGKYTKEVFKDINLTETLNQAMKGEVDASSITRGIFDILGVELKQQITMISSIIVIIVIHSILKSFSDGLDNGRN